VPADYTASKVWPVIVELHANGPQGTDGLKPTRFELGNLIRRSRDSFPAIIIFPQAPSGHFWEELPMQQLVLAELEATEREFRTDATRVYLTGFSMGGLAAYRLAFRWPDRFAALFVVAGRVLFLNRPESLSRFQLDRETNLFPAATDPYAALAARLRDLRIWLFHGAADAAIDVEQSRRLVEALKNVSAEVRYTELPGLGHNEAAEKAYSLEVFEWLLSQRRRLPAR
jgi:predicted peptidase